MYRLTLLPYFFVQLLQIPEFVMHDYYNAILERLNQLKAEGASAQELAACSKELKLASREVYAAKKAAVAQQADPALAHQVYPPPTDMPLDAEGFVVAFPCPTGPGVASSADEEEVRVAAREFYAQYGFVVFSNAIDAERCAATRAEVWASLEAATPGLQRDDVHSYARIGDVRDRAAIGGTETYGLAPQPSIFTPEVMRNRQDPRVIGAMALLIGSEDILVSQDRWCVYRPTRGLPGAAADGKGDGDDVLVDRPEWKTRGNLHLDLHPWNYLAGTTDIDELAFDGTRDFPREINMVSAAGGPHLQGVLALLDNREQDGGTLVVPGFHSVFAEWVAALGPVEGHLPSYLASKGGHGSSNWMVPREGGGGSYKFTDVDPVCGLARRVPLREGSFLIWDQRVVHGSQPNDSAQCRMAQFIKGFCRAKTGEGRRQARARIIAREIEQAGTLDELTPLGRKVFGLA